MISRLCLGMMRPPENPKKRLFLLKLYFKIIHIGKIFCDIRVFGKSHDAHTRIPSMKNLICLIRLFQAIFRFAFSLSVFINATAIGSSPSLFCISCP